MNWEVAKKHLSMCESGYTEVGTAGFFALVCVIRPLRDRFNSGERSEDLYQEIMEVSL